MSEQKKDNRTVWDFIKEFLNTDPMFHNRASFSDADLQRAIEIVEPLAQGPEDAQTLNALTEVTMAVVAASVVYAKDAETASVQVQILPSILPTFVVRMTDYAIRQLPQEEQDAIRLRTEMMAHALVTPTKGVN